MPTLLNLLEEGKIHSFIFDKYNQCPNLRVLPVRLQDGTLEAFMSDDIVVRKKLGIFRRVILSDLDIYALMLAFDLRAAKGISDRMGEIPIGLDYNRLSPGSREDNYILPKETIDLIYQQAKMFQPDIDDKTNLPLSLRLELEYPRDFCYFDKKPIENGSICKTCKLFLVKEYEFSIPEEFVGIDRDVKKDTNNAAYLHMGKDFS